MTRFLNLPFIVLLISTVFFGVSQALALWPTHGAKRPNRPGIVYWHGDETRKRVALTFDDGPSVPYTEQILDILKENNVKGTFFMIGKNAERYPALAQRIVAEGHTIGNHSFSHRSAKYFDGKKMRNDWQRGEAAIQGVTGQRTVLFRPPHGKLNGPILKLAKEKGWVAVEWTVSPKDWSRPGDAAIVNRVLAKVKNGGIVLLHDGHPDNEKGDRSHTVRALPALIAALRTQGYELVTVPELLNLDNNTMQVRNDTILEAQKP